MLFEKLSIENYGVYANRSEFDLVTSPEKPIILVGGLNGAGKTTIFESIMIALYGRTYLGRKTSKKDYLQFISDKIHRHDGKRASHASVEVTFKFYHNNSIDTYVVNRGWDVNGASISESLSIQKNGKPMIDVNESLWQSFIEGLIPLGIARLFFFDGEKIVRITQWNEKDNEELKSSLDMLLGAELISRLRSDLNLYTVRKSSNTGGLAKTDQKKYEAMTQENDSLSTELEELVTEGDKINEKIKDTTSQISLKESKMATLGGGYSKIRNDLLAKKAVLEDKIMHSRKQIQDELAGDAPFYLLSPSLLEGVKKQIKKDVDVMRQRLVASAMQDEVRKLKDDMTSPQFSDNMNRDTLDTILQRLDKMVKMPRGDVFFDMSPNEVDWITQKIAKIRDGHDEIPTRLVEYGRTIQLLEKIESDLAQAPKDDELGPHVTHINGLYEEIGILKTELAHIEQKISSKRAYQKILRSKILSILKLIHKNNTSAVGVKMASKMQDALDTYYASLKSIKIKELESHLLATTKILLHKKLISKITIDRETFEIKVYGDDEQIPGGLLSMGERQIVGTALLWAIARTCGRTLPFVIDTPLGRLDGEHLVNLTERFYPYASHQLILLSTDREIGQKEYVKLSKYISKSYRITCDYERSVTTVSSGYFLEKKIA